MRLWLRHQRAARTGHLGHLGRVYRKVNEAEATFATVITNMMTGQYERPVRVVEFTCATRGA
jgi:hypothetical protein